MNRNIDKILEDYPNLSRLSHWTAPENLDLEPQIAEFNTFCKAIEGALLEIGVQPPMWRLMWSGKSFFLKMVLFDSFEEVLELDYKAICKAIKLLAPSYPLCQEYWDCLVYAAKGTIMEPQLKAL